MAPRRLPWHSADKGLHLAPIPPEHVGKVKSAARRTGRELSTSGCQAGVGQTSTPAWVHGPNCLATGLLRGAPAAWPAPSIPKGAADRPVRPAARDERGSAK